MNRKFEFEHPPTLCSETATGEFPDLFPSPAKLAVVYMRLVHVNSVVIQCPRFHSDLAGLYFPDRVANSLMCNATTPKTTLNRIIFIRIPDMSSLFF